MAKLLRLLVLALALASAPALAVPGRLNGIPQCTPKQVPFKAGYWPRVVMYGDSITQHGHEAGVHATGNGIYNPSITPSVTTFNGNPVIQYNGTDAGTLGLYYGQTISGTGIVAGSYVVGAVDATHIRINQNATANGTVTATLTFPAAGPQVGWTMFTAAAGEMVDLQSAYPYFRYDQWNDVSRNFAAFANAPPFMRGGNMGYSGASTTDLLNHTREVMALDPDILVISVGVNNIGSGTFQSDMSQLVDTFHAWCPSLPIVLSNIRATDSTNTNSRATGGIVYDNTLIASIISARPWLRSLDLFTPYANSSASGGSLALPGTTISLNSTSLGIAALLPGQDVRQIGIRAGQSVSGAGIPGGTTIVFAQGGTVTMSAQATAGSTGTVTFSPFYGLSGNEVGLQANYNTVYPNTYVGDGLHPGVYGAWLAMPNFKAVLCPLLAGNCASSTTSNTLLDNHSPSMLTTNPASLLTGTTAAVYHTGTATVTGLTGTWTSPSTSITLSGSNAGIYTGMCVSGTGLGTNSTVASISGTALTVAPATASSGSGTALTFSPCVAGTSAQGMDVALGSSAYLSSYAVSVASNTETGGNMIQISVAPNGTNTKEAIIIRPTAIALSSTLCAGKWCQMWAEFEVDQNPGWVNIDAQAKERLAAYSSLYLTDAVQSILPYSSGTRRIWSHTECFPYPYNSSGITPSFNINWAPSLATGTPQINLRRWDIRQCSPPPQDLPRARRG